MHTHTHRHIHRHRDTQRHTHTLTHTHTNIHTHTQTYIHTQTHTETHTETHTDTHKRTHINTHTHTHTHTPSHIRTHTHKAKQIKDCSFCFHGHVYQVTPGCLCTMQALRVCAGKYYLGGAGQVPCRSAVHASWMTVWTPVVPPGPQPLNETWPVGICFPSYCQVPINTAG